MLPPVVRPFVQSHSEPYYPHVHSGTVLVAGSAWCTQDDVERALHLRPKVPIITVNRSAGHFKSILMVTIDRGKGLAWKQSHMDNFREPVTLHAGRFGGKGKMAYPWVDYFWPQYPSGGTSVWLAAKIALGIGFEEVIVCGAPLECGPYLDGDNDPKEGWTTRTPVQLESYRKVWRYDKFMHPHVRSMSGWTMDLLGYPDVK